MRTSWPNTPSPAIEGTLVGEALETRPGDLPYLAQIETFTIADSEAGDALLTVVDDETGQTYARTIAISGAVEATSLDELVAGVQGDGKLSDLFVPTEDGTSLFTLTARHANRSYTISLDLPGAMTATQATAQAAGGAGIELGAFVAKGSGVDEMLALSGSTALANLLGVTYRTDANHTQPREGAAVDTLARGKKHRVLGQGRILMRAETAVTKGGAVHVRRAGSGKIGGVRGSADSSNTIDVSSIASFETSAGAGELVRVSVRMPA